MQVLKRRCPQSAARLLAQMLAGAAALTQRAKGVTAQDNLKRFRGRNCLQFSYCNDLYCVFNKLPSAVQTYYLGMSTLCLESI